VIYKSFDLNRPQHWLTPTTRVRAVTKPRRESPKVPNWSQPLGMPKFAILWGRASGSVTLASGALQIGLLLLLLLLCGGDIAV